MTTLDVAMFGPSRVGKTSLLASMYHQFDSEIARTELTLLAETITQSRLSRAYRQLITFPESKGLSGGVPSDDKPNDYVFKLGIRRESEVLNIVFHDYPGGYLSHEDTINVTRVREMFSKSSLLLVAIDTPALMESKGNWSFLHDVHNEPQMLASILQDEADRQKTSGGSPRMAVIFVPLKCEVYLKTDSEARRLLERVKEGYSKSFSILAESALAENTAVVIAPVKTIGCVHFDRLASQANPSAPASAGDYSFYFKKTSSDALYSPEYTEQPLRYLLSFYLSTVMDFGIRAKSLAIQAGEALDQDELLKAAAFAWKALVNKTAQGFRSATKTFDIYPGREGDAGEFVDFLAGNSRIRHAVDSFAAERKSSAPFEVVQRKSLFAYDEQ